MNDILGDFRELGEDTKRWFTRRHPLSLRRWSLAQHRKPLTWLQVEGILILALDEVTLEPAAGLQFEALAAIVVFQLRQAGIKVTDDRPTGPTTSLSAGQAPAAGTAGGHATPGQPQTPRCGGQVSACPPALAPRVRASCSCGWSWEGPDRAWDWVSGRHAHAHNKGVGGLAAGGRWESVEYIAPKATR